MSITYSKILIYECSHWLVLVYCPWQIMLTRFSPFYLVYTLHCFLQLHFFQTTLINFQTHKIIDAQCNMRFLIHCQHHQSQVYNKSWFKQDYILAIQSLFFFLPTIPMKSDFTVYYIYPGITFSNMCLMWHPLRCRYHNYMSINW